MSFTNQISEFITIYPGSLTTSLELLTQGVAWLDPVVIEPAATRGSAPALTSSPAGVRMAWSGQTGGRGAVFYTYQTASGNDFVWSDPVNVSSGAQADAVHPQIASAQDGSVVVVWEENGAVVSSRCQEAACSAPAVLSEQVAACTQDAQAARAWPAVAINSSGQVMVAWSAGAGQVEYGLWNTAGDTAPAQSGCLQFDSSAALQPRLAAGASARWRLAASSGPDEPAQPVFSLEFQDGAWGQPQNLGAGSGVELYAAQDGSFQLAWCSPDQQLIYQVPGGSSQTAAQSGCSGRPALVEDAAGQVHLLYTASTLADNFGNERSVAHLVEITRLEQGWSQPVLISGFVPPNQPAAAADPLGKLYLAADEVLLDNAQVKVHRPTGLRLRRRDFAAARPGDAGCD